MCPVPTERFELDDDEVTVLNHVISALAERDDFEQLVPHRADQQAIHNLVCLLEREDRIAFSKDYTALLDQARQRLLPEDD